MASMIAAGTAYATHGEHMIPIYIFYSMFGFQRTGDQMWAARRPDGPRLPARRHRRPHHAERRGPAARGRSLAAARLDEPGRACPTTRRGRYEIAHIVQDGLRRMYGRRGAPARRDIFYYLTIYNEPYRAAGRARRTSTCEGLLKGLYRFAAGAAAESTARPRAQILASGVAMPWALEAQRMLAEEWGVAADVWSATSWTELRREALAVRRAQPAQPGRASRACRT